MPRWARSLGVVALVALVLGTGPGMRPASAQVDPAVRDRVVAAAVQIAVWVTLAENGASFAYPFPLGSGTVVSPDGLILTNWHVVDRAARDELLAALRRQAAKESPNATLSIPADTFAVLGSDGVRPPVPRYTATLVTGDVALDLAILRVTGDAEGRPLAPDRFPLPFVPLGDSDAVGLGDRVDIFAFPAIGAGSLALTTGVVSGFAFEDQGDDPAWLVTDAVMSGGSSGGTAVNDAGQLIGVPTQGSALDCRPGDTNGDGKVDAADVGCVPTGGSLGELRPINLARPLLGRVDPTLGAPTTGLSNNPERRRQPVPTPPAMPPTGSLPSHNQFARHGLR